MSVAPKVAVIVGAGPAAWITAIALKRAFQHIPLDVTVIEHGDAPQRGAVISTLPSIRQLHRLIGLDERAFVTETGAAFKIAARHDGWAGEGASFIHPYGEIGVDLQSVHFYKYLAKQAMGGRAPPVEAFSLAAAAARADRFGRPMQDPKSVFGSYTYAFHVDAFAYAALLRTHALKQAVKAAAGHVKDVSIAADGAIEALVLEDGSRIAGDVFVDCSGSEALLMRRMAPEVEDWSGWFSCDRMLQARASENKSLPPYTLTKATRAGWMSRAPLQHSEGAAYVYSSIHLRDDAALHDLGAFVGGDLADAAATPLRQQRRRRFWVKNCVAIGGAALALEPLASTELQVVQLGLSNLVNLFPLSYDQSVEAAEFDRVMGEHAAGLRDFVLAQYRLSAHPLAKEADAPLPDRLQYKLDTFMGSGHILVFDFETFEETDWAALLLGLGCAPTGMGLHFRLHLDALDPRMLEHLSNSIRGAAQSMPPQREYLMRSKLMSAAGDGAAHA